LLYPHIDSIALTFTNKHSYSILWVENDYEVLRINKETRIAKSAVWILRRISILSLLLLACKDVGVQPSNKSFILAAED